MNHTENMLPQEFLTRMKALLGSEEEYESFLAAYEKPRERGMRLNTLKVRGTEELPDSFPYQLEAVPWTRDGFWYQASSDLKIPLAGQHPYYYAGLYYLQEPSAMLPASILPVEPGERVLDLCAAPGGKATALGAKLGGTGILLANEISASRAKALIRNLELAGITNSYVTNEVPAHMAGRFPDYFDKILVDAPCSGEGMFRKDDANAHAWSMKKVQECAKIQKELVVLAASMLRPGGRMVYSTCTFSPEEDEQVVAWLLSQCPEMELCEIPPQEGFLPGRPELCDPDWSGRGMVSAADFGSCVTDEADPDPERIRRCVRLYPHHIRGEGHFIALFRKKEPDETPLSGQYRNDGPAESAQGTVGDTLPEEQTGDRVSSLADGGDPDSPKWKQYGRKEKSSGRSRTGKGLRFAENRDPSGISAGEMEALQEFFGDLPFDLNRIRARNGHLALLPRHFADLEERLSGLTVLRRGVYLGEVSCIGADKKKAQDKKNGRKKWMGAGEASAFSDSRTAQNRFRFEPSQSLALAAVPWNKSVSVSFEADDPRVRQYLKGETILLEDPEIISARGWVLVCVDGMPLGWGKTSGNQIKNKYHTGWRIQY